MDFRNSGDPEKLYVEFCDLVLFRFFFFRKKSKAFYQILSMTAGSPKVSKPDSYKLLNKIC